MIDDAGKIRVLEIDAHRQDMPATGISRPARSGHSSAALIASHNLGSSWPTSLSDPSPKATLLPLLRCSLSSAIRRQSTRCAPASTGSRGIRTTPLSSLWPMAASSAWSALPSHRPTRTTSRPAALPLWWSTSDHQQGRGIGDQAWSRRRRRGPAQRGASDHSAHQPQPPRGRPRVLSPHRLQRDRQAVRARSVGQFYRGAFAP